MIAYAVVCYNDQDDPDLPIKGAFKVYCPDVFGYELPKGVTSVSGAAAYEYMYDSPWVLPCLQSYDDFFLPAVGDSVYIDFVDGLGSNPIFYGIAPESEDFFNQMTNSMQAAHSKQLEDPNIDRIVGIRKGSYIKFYNDDSGKIVIETLGKTVDNPTRVGSRIELDGENQTAKVMAQTDDGSNQYTLECDAVNELVRMVTAGGKEFSLDDINAITGLVDDLGNGIEMGDSGVTITDKDGNTVVMSDSGITVTDAINTQTVEMNSDGIKATDMNSHTIEMTSSGLVFNGNAHKLKLNNTAQSLGSLIDSLITTISGMKTTGSPALHTISPDDIFSLNSIKTQFTLLLED